MINNILLIPVPADHKIWCHYLNFYADDCREIVALPLIYDTDSGFFWDVKDIREFLESLDGRFIVGLHSGTYRVCPLEKTTAQLLHQALDERRRKVFVLSVPTPTKNEYDEVVEWVNDNVKGRFCKRDWPPYPPLFKAFTDCADSAAHFKLRWG